MKVTFLGTAAAEGIPSPFCDCPVCEHARANGGRNVRRRQSVIVNDDLLIDFGPDVYASCGALGVSLTKVLYTLVTHSHSDHFAPADLVMRAKPYHLANDLPEMILAAGPSSLTLWDMTGEAGDRYAGIRRLPMLPGRSAQLGPYSVRAIEATHNSRIGDAMNYVISDGSVKLLYASDSGMYAEHVWEELRDLALDALIMEGTIWKHPPGREHLNESDFALMLEHMRRVGAIHDGTVVVATHFSHQGAHTHDEMVESLKPYGAICAYDGFVLEV